MYITQISVFIENKPGRLCEVTELLSNHHIDLRAMCLADTADFGILRIIVNDPDTVVEILRNAGLTVRLTKVLGVALPDHPGALSSVLTVLRDSGIAVEYAYAFIARVESRASVILKVGSIEAAASALEQANVTLLGTIE